MRRERCGIEGRADIPSVRAGGRARERGRQPRAPYPGLRRPLRRAFARFQVATAFGLRNKLGSAYRSPFRPARARSLEWLRRYLRPGERRAVCALLGRESLTPDGVGGKYKSWSFPPSAVSPLWNGA